DGSYRWVLDRSSEGTDTQAPPEMIASQLPDCSASAPGRPGAAALAYPASGQSNDRSLAWWTTQGSDRNYVSQIFIYSEGEYRPVLDEAVWRRAQEHEALIELFLSAFNTLFVVIDPPGCAPIYVGLTQGASEAEKRAMAIRACLIAGTILLIFALFGERLLAALHI